MIASLPYPDLAPYAGVLVSFFLHATLLLFAVWLAERMGWLKHAGWAEWAWRVALFGAFVSVAVEMAPTIAMPTTATTAMASSPADSVPADSMPAQMAQTPASERAGIAATAENAVRADAATLATASESPARESTHAPPPLALPIADDALLIALILWLAGTLLLSVRMGYQAAALLRLKRRLVREGTPADADMHALLRTLAREMRMREPRLRVLPNLSSPLALPGAVLLPRWAGGLDVHQQRAMLAHELAHLRRRDPLWRPLQRLALVPLFFHPLAWHALRRLETLAEHLCDAAAVEHSRDGRALAECLAECLARSSMADRTPDTYAMDGAGWALAMAERDSGIVDRVRTLLETSHMKFSAIPLRWRWTAAAVALAVLIALPGVVVIARPGALSSVLRQHDVVIAFRDRGSKFIMTSDDTDAGEILRVDVVGDVAFNAEESDIARMADNGSFELEQRGKLGPMRKLLVESDGKSLKRTYTVDGAAHAYDAEAKAWLAATIPDIFRRSGAQAESRSKRLLAEGGVPRLLQEVALLKSDSARAAYLGEMFRQATPDAAQTAQALAILQRVDSDFEKRNAMDAVLSSGKLDAGNQRALLALAPGIESDFERAEWLIDASETIRIDGENTALWSNAVIAFDSDFERARTLEALIAYGAPREQAVAVAMRGINGMSSDFERRSVLEDAAKAGVAMSDLDYLSAVDGMSSDFEKREALLALLRGRQADAARARAVLDSVRRMDSDFERGEVLVALAQKMPKDEALIEAYREVTRDMNDLERGQAEKALDRFYRG